MPSRINRPSRRPSATRSARRISTWATPPRRSPRLERTVELRKAQLGPEHRDTLESRSNLASAILDAGRTARGDRDVPGDARADHGELGPDNPLTLDARNNLATAYRAAGRTAEAIAMHKETLRLRQAKLGPDHPDTLESRNNLARPTSAPGGRPRRSRCTRRRSG